MEIKKINGEIIFKSDVDNIKDAVKETVIRGANLGGADLHGADLGGAYLYGADLHGAYLGGADLHGADLHGANLRCANLGGANLGGADLGGADLHGAKLVGADLIDTDLGGADLHGANLIDTDLGGADLGGADLGGADLYGAKLVGADLHGANLGGAYLRCANLHGANLHGAINIPHIPLACPSEGSFTAWKKVNGKLVELEIPADARRSSATTEKCRCDKAKVISITDIASNEQNPEITNFNHVTTLYKVGEMVYPDEFDEDRFNECSNGIHFFIDKHSAINY